MVLLASQGLGPLQPIVGQAGQARAGGWGVNLAMQPVEWGGFRACWLGLASAQSCKEAPLGRRREMPRGWAVKPVKPVKWNTCGGFTVL